MSNYIKLTHPNICASGLKLLNGEITYNWKNLINADPGDSFLGDVEVQTNGWENPVFNLTFHIPIDTDFSDGSTWMNWSKWMQLVKNQPDGTDSKKILLELAVGDSDIKFNDYSSSVDDDDGRTSIPVVIKSFGLKLSPANSNNAYFWTINAQLQVDK